MPRILCAGIAVLDQIFRVEAFPRPDTKARATEFISIGGGCAANAAVTVVRLGGRAEFVGPLGGPAGKDATGNEILAALRREKVDCDRCLRVPGAPSPVSMILIDGRGERMIVTHRDERLLAAEPADAAGLLRDVDVVLADNRFPNFVLPICKAARARSIPVVLDADKPSQGRDALFRIASHVVFSAEALRGTIDEDDLAVALTRMASLTGSFLAVTNGADDILWWAGSSCRRLPVFPVEAVDTLAAGDVLHGAFALALAEGSAAVEGLRFAAAAAGLKCRRFGGIAGAPWRGELDAVLAKAPELDGT